MTWINLGLGLLNLTLLVCNIWQNICDKPAHIVFSTEDKELLGLVKDPPPGIGRCI